MDKNVQLYIESANAGRKASLQTLIDLIADITKEPPKMWGSSIISFGLYRYKYESGREGEAPRVGMSNRKQAIVLYGLQVSDNDHPNRALLEKLGKHKTGKGCLYITDVSDIDLEILAQIIRHSLVSDTN